MALDEVGAKRRSRRIRRALVWSFVWLLLVAGVWAVFFSSFLAAESVEVRGVGFATVDEVVSAAAIDLGTPIAAIDAEEVRRRITQLPPVVDVEVRRVFPHTVLLVVKEREPVATISAEGGWAMLDLDGVVFGKAAARPANLPAVEAATARGRAAAASVAAQLPLWVNVDLDRVLGISSDDVRLLLKDGRRILWGSDERTQRKLQVLQPLLDLPAEIYDVSAPDVPTTRGKPKPAETGS